MNSELLKGIHWLGHAGFLIEGEKTVYIDPFRIGGRRMPAADIILVSHAHYDHCSARAIEKISTPDTVVVTCGECARKLRGNIRAISAGETMRVRGVTVEALPAYNTNKQFHPRPAGGLGFIVTMGGRRIYFAGDTDLIPEMAAVTADVALLPVSGTYVMSAGEAAEAAALIGPRVAVPMHYGSVAGGTGDARSFEERAPVPVAILEKE